jgi:hypothetical protein
MFQNDIPFWSFLIFISTGSTLNCVEGDVKHLDKQYNELPASRNKI